MNADHTWRYPGGEGWAQRLRDRELYVRLRGVRGDDREVGINGTLIIIDKLVFTHLLID